MSRGTTAIIDFNNLRHNFKVLSQLAPGRLVLVVKADAYGHGLKQIVTALDKVDCFAVATIDEALLVRAVKPQVRILLLEGYLDAEELQIAFENRFDSVIHQQQQIDLLLQSKTTAERKINIWLKLDSGMNRLGFNAVEFLHALTILKTNKNTQEVILMTHFASADAQDSSKTEQQKKHFTQLLGGYNQLNYPLSLSNSSALLNGYSVPQEWSRVGLALFGVSPIANTLASTYNLKPVMTLKANIIAIKNVKAGECIGYSQTFQATSDRLIAIVGIGYGDGYPWQLSAAAHVKISQQQANIVGRVSMDMLAVDITEIKPVNIGDSVLIWGQQSDTNLPLETVAKNAMTIPYVLLCQLTSRVKYHYITE